MTTVQLQRHFKFVTYQLAGSAEAAQTSQA